MGYKGTAVPSGLSADPTLRMARGFSRPQTLAGSVHHCLRKVGADYPRVTAQYRLIQRKSRILSTHKSFRRSTWPVRRLRNWTPCFRVSINLFFPHLRARVGFCRELRRVLSLMLSRILSTYIYIPTVTLPTP